MHHRQVLYRLSQQGSPAATWIQRAWAQGGRLAHTQGRRHRSTRRCCGCCHLGLPTGPGRGRWGEDSEAVALAQPLGDVPGGEPPTEAWQARTPSCSPSTGVGSREGRQVPGEVGPGSAPRTASDSHLPATIGRGPRAPRTMSSRESREQEALRGDVLCDDSMLFKLPCAREPGSAVQTEVKSERASPLPASPAPPATGAVNADVPRGLQSVM